MSDIYSSNTSSSISNGNIVVVNRMNSLTIEVYQEKIEFLNERRSLHVHNTEHKS